MHKRIIQHLGRHADEEDGECLRNALGYILSGKKAQFMEMLSIVLLNNSSVDINMCIRNMYLY